MFWITMLLILPLDKAAPRKRDVVHSTLRSLFFVFDHSSRTTRRWIASKKKHSTAKWISSIRDLVFKKEARQYHLLMDRELSLWFVERTGCSSCMPDWIERFTGMPSRQEYYNCRTSRRCSLLDYCQGIPSWKLTNLWIIQVFVYFELFFQEFPKRCMFARVRVSVYIFFLS